MEYIYGDKVEITKGFYKGQAGFIDDYERVPQLFLKLFPNYNRRYSVKGYGWFFQGDLEKGDIRK
jgi:hypothetical protein